MTLAPVRRPTCEARPAAWKASPITYTPPWKYRTTLRASIPSMVISAVGTPPSAAAVTVTPGGSGCAEANSASSRRCSLTSLSNGKADCRRIASRFSRWSVLTEDLPSVETPGSTPGGLAHVNSVLKFLPGVAGHCQPGRQEGEEASPDHGDSRDQSTAEPIDHGHPGREVSAPLTARTVAISAITGQGSLPHARPGTSFVSVGGSQRGPDRTLRSQPAPRRLPTGPAGQ